MSPLHTKYWSAPAKINWFLNIVGQRTDGYHLLQSAFQFLDLHDTLILKPHSNNEITRIAPEVQIDETDDLTIRAAKALQAATQVRRGASIKLIKRIPIGAGLGGGSSDAATTLVALNQLWDTRLSQDELAQIGLALGADIPFFIRGRSAWGESVGERLTPIRLPEVWLSLIYPQCLVPTASIFRHPKLTRNSVVRKIPPVFKKSTGFWRQRS